MYSTAARAKSTSTVLEEEAEEEGEEEEDVDDGAVLAEDCEGDGEESKTMPLLVAAAGWSERVREDDAWVCVEIGFVEET
jgi:hypothetical protein